MALLWLAAWLPVQGHEVREQVRQDTAVVVTLAYADDAPFSFERYELFAEGQDDRPVHVGRTDAKGRIVFLPDGQPRWRLRSFSGDGHGVDFTFEVQAGPAAATAAAPGHERLLRIAAGLAVIAVLYGMLRWRLRSRRAQP